MNILLLFPGQGSQTATLENCYNQHPELLKHIQQELSFHLNIDLYTILKNPHQLSNGLFTQPLLVAHELIFFQYLQQKGCFNNHHIALAGHSLGELSAVCASLDTPISSAINLAQQRAQLMQQCCPHDSVMYAVLGRNLHTLAHLIKEQGVDIHIVNHNSPNQSVIGGQKDAIDSFIPVLEKQKHIRRVVKLPMSTLSHCPVLKDIVPPWKNHLEQQLPSQDSGQYFVYSNQSTHASNERCVMIDKLSQQLIEPVYFYQMIDNVIKSCINIIIEIGPKNILTQMLKKSLPSSVACYSTACSQEIHDVINILEEKSCIPELS